MESLLVSANRRILLGLKVYTLCNICRSSPIIPVATSDVSVNPVISASKELKKSKEDSRLLRRVRPSTARPANTTRHKLQ